MTLLDVLRHQWRRQVRSPTWGRSLVGGIILAAAAAYLAVSFVGLGWIYPRVVAEVAPRRDPLRLLNASLLAGGILLTIGRFLLQRSPGTAVQPYRALPVPAGRLARAAQATAALSLFNLLPGLTLAALWASTVRPATSTLGAALWAGGALLAVASTEFANTLLRVAWERSAALTVGGGGVLAVAGGLAPAAGTGGLGRLSAWLFGGLATGEVVPLAVLLLSAGAGAGAAHRALRDRLYDVVGAASEERSWAALGPRLDRWRAPRGASALALLDLKLILRNKRPRQALLAQLPLVGVFGAQFFLLMPDLDGHMGALVVTIYGLVLTGQLGLAYHGLGYAWHGSHFDGLLARARAPHVLVRGQHVSFAGLCLGQSVLVSLFGVARPALLVPMGSLLLYHLGVTAPALLVGSAWTREAIRLDEGAMFNYQGSTTTHFVGVGLATVALMGLPVGLMMGLGRGPALAGTAGLGLLGLAAAPVWTRWVGALLRRRRHAMAAGFRATDS
jgi:hypothetical protein